MDISGTWYNELGSTMKLNVAADGTVSGVYQTVVGNAEGEYKLSGRTEVKSANNIQNIGFVVSWQNKYKDSHSVTAWSGQVQVVKGKEVMRTTWLLTNETDPSNNWSSTRVSIDVFTREKPSEETVARAKLYGISAFPSLA